MENVVELLEREGPLIQLHTAWARARCGVGEVAVVAAEAGAGKTTLVREFLRQAAGRPAVLFGACDPLSTPRPLGPLIDAVGMVDPELAMRLAGNTSRAEVFAAAISLVDGSRTDAPGTVFVLEDMHWADDATLDLLTFLGRRVARLPALLVVTYRDDEVDRGHPLRSRLGEMTQWVRSRVSLTSLSRDAVAALAGDADIDVDELHRATGGNPFYVTEVLGAGGGIVPDSVRDAVLARAARLPPEPRAVLDAAAIVPGRAERWLIEAMVGDDVAAVGLEECLDRSLLHADAAGALGFHHELARTAIADAVPVRRRRKLHGFALTALRGPQAGRPDHARIAHHADQAGDAVAVLAHAPAAAVEAAAVGSHRAAASHLDAALRHAAGLDPTALGDLLLRRGTVRARLGRSNDALDDFTRARELFARVGDVERQGVALARSGRPLTALGRQPDADAAVDDAVARLAGRPPSDAKALVSVSVATNHMLARRLDECEVEAHRAIAWAQQFGNDDVLAEACVQTGIALAMSADESLAAEGLARVRWGIDVAQACGNDAMVALGHSQIGSGFGELRQYDNRDPRPA